MWKYPSVRANSQYQLGTWSTCHGRTEITDIIHHKNSQILKPSSCPSPSLMTSLKYYWEPICQMCKSPQPSLIIPWTINIPGGDRDTGKSKSNSGRLSTAFDRHFALFTMSRGVDICTVLRGRLPGVLEEAGRPLLQPADRLPRDGGLQGRLPSPGGRPGKCAQPEGEWIPGRLDQE